jgi:4,5-DOPA dioxygenase extradiol
VSFEGEADMSNKKTVMPAVFFGHGNPMNALGRNAWTDGWSAIGAAVPTPRAILCISAHWYLPATLVTATPTPRTIHDFGGFPRELYEFEYPAPGDPELASRIRDLLAPINVRLDERWGLDHGRGLCLHMSIQMQIFLWSNSALTKHSPPNSTMRQERG